ncbi:MAG: inorganic phosphate transporter, partial [Pseudomonadota bacterium]|nr:inorganic phosphate transporter [Pseudomonadota bacterium]
MATLNSPLPDLTASGSRPRLALPNIGFALLLALSGGAFLVWGAGYIGSGSLLIFVLATLFGLFMAFNIGGNDVANSFGTSVGAGTLTIGQALGVAAIFEVSGAVIAGGDVTDTIRSGIVDLGALAVSPLQFIRVMMAALVAAAFWLLFASRRGWPVSTTHSIIGGIVGASVVLGVSLGGTSSALALVQWDEIARIALSWVISPLLGGLVSYGLFRLIKHH